MARISDGAQFDPCPVHVSQATWQRAEETGRVALSASDRDSIAQALDFYVSASKRFTDSATFGNICEPLDEVAKAASGFQKLMRKLESMPPRSESGANENTTVIKAIGTSLAAFLDEKSVSLVVEKAETQLKAARSWETRLYGIVRALAQVATPFVRPDINGTIVGSKRLLDLVAEITKFSKGLQRALDGLQRQHVGAPGTAAEHSAVQSARGTAPWKSG
jgi:hypothetical protein